MAAKIFTSVSKGFADFKGATINTVIATGTLLVEQLINYTVYYCPCVEPIELGTCNSTSNSKESKAECTPFSNYLYGVIFIIVPAVALFFLIAASTPRLWKLWTGTCKKTKETKARSDKVIWTIVEIFSRSLVAPIAWVSFALLDGKYYACSITPQPYAIGTTYPTCQDVAKANKPTYSDAYRDNRSLSQLYGWVVIGISVILGFGAYAISRCVYPLTYYHAKYYDRYRSYEESEFDQEMDVKAQKYAEENVLKFMAKNRAKKTWDHISTVYEFHRNPKNVALYSYLHEFILEEESKKPLLPANSDNEEITAV